MPTIHEQIDELIAADLHGELSIAERDAFHAHLVDCADCRQAFQEEKNMHKILNETFAGKKADTGFEQRMVSRFRDRVPKRTGLIGLFTYHMRARTLQISAVAALLLALVGTGGWLTSADAYLGNEELAVQAVTDDGSLRNLREKLAGADLLATYQQRPPPPPPFDEYRSDQDKPGASRDSGVLAKTDDRTKSLAATTAPPPPAKKDKANTPVEGLRQLPSFVGQTDTENNSAGPSEYPEATTERVTVTGSYIPTAETESALPVAVYSADALKSNPAANRKLIRNATAELEVVSFDESVQKITTFTSEEKGYVATTSSEKQANGKLRGEIVVKILPESLDRFLGKLRGIGELKNQALTTEDVTKAYFDTESRLKNARLMEQRLAEILKTKSNNVGDLLKVEKEIGRVREEIEKMQGELKFMDSQVAFATVTITLAEKNMNISAAFLLKERAQLSLYATEVEKTYNEIKALASPKVQITNAQIDRDNTGRVSARVSLLLVPDDSEAVINKIKGMARVENFQVSTERVSQGGDGLSENAKTERDKVQLDVTLSRDEQEIALQQTSLQIETPQVNERTKQLRSIAEQQGGRIRSSSFSRDPDGREFSRVSLRVPMKNYSALMQALNGLGKVENVSVQREDRPNSQIDEANAPADVSMTIYSQGNLVSADAGIWATLRRTIGQGAAALMWSARMIGVALAFLAPWLVAIIGAGWVMRRVSRARRGRKQRAEEQDGLS